MVVDENIGLTSQGLPESYLLDSCTMVEDCFWYQVRELGLMVQHRMKRDRKHRSNSVTEKLL